MSKINLTLEAQDCEIDGVTLFEPIDITILNKLLKSDLLQSTFHNSILNVKYDSEFELLNNYKNLIKNGMAEVTYNKVKGVKYGRVLPKNALGLFNIRRELRHTLAKGYFIDIDIENCHPVILYQICKANDIECDYLEEYVLNRKKYLEEVQNTYNVSRDVAKRLFIKLMYFGGFNSWAEQYGVKQEPTKMIIRFKKEVQEIGSLICEKNHDIKKAIRKRKEEQKQSDYNEIGTVVSYFLQEIECRILESLYLYCIKSKYVVNNICVLCADGLMIKKEHYKSEILNEFTDLIKKKFGFELTFTQKEMNEDYLNILDEHILSENQLIIKQMNGYDNSNTFDKSKDFQIGLLTELFKSDLAILGPDKYIEFFHHTKSFKYFNHYHSHFYLSNKVHKIHFSNIVEYKDFNASFNQLNFIHNKVNYKFTTLYDRSEYRNCNSTFDFEPNKKEIDDKYNLFRGFIYDSENSTFDFEIIKPYLEHLQFLVSNDSKSVELYNYILNWMAHIIQKPEVKTDVAIVFFSLFEGAGKNILFDIFAGLLEGYTAKFKDTNSLTDRFNGEMSGKLFCIGDEIKARAQDVANELKDIITRKKEIIEFKGKDKIYVKDFKNYTFTTNNENVFKIDNTDRRYLFIECPEETKNATYFNRLISFLNDKTKLTNLFNFLKTRDISNFNPRHIIITDYKLRLILANAPAYIKFIKDEYETYSDQYLTIDSLFKSSIEYAKRNKMISSYTPELFYKQFKRVFGEFQKKKNNKSFYYFDSKDKLNECILNNFLSNL